jgi:hypothetical protein
MPGGETLNYQVREDRVLIRFLLLLETGHRLRALRHVRDQGHVRLIPAKHLKMTELYVGAVLALIDEGAFSG